jgi:hypothetical protein
LQFERTALEHLAAICAAAKVPLAIDAVSTRKAICGCKFIEGKDNRSIFWRSTAMRWRC